MNRDIHSKRAVTSVTLQRLYVKALMFIVPENSNFT